MLFLNLTTIISILFISFLFIEIIQLYEKKTNQTKLFYNKKKGEIQEIFGEVSLNWSNAAGLDETSESGSETFGDSLLFLGLISAFLSFIPFIWSMNADFTFILSFSLFIILLSFLIFVPLTLMKVFTEVVERKSPLILIPLLVLIETISYFFKIMSLAIRLSVNTATGHALSLIFFTLACNMLENLLKFFPKLLSIFFYFFSIIYMTMEIFISLLQLYVIHLLAYYYEYENF